MNTWMIGKNFMIHWRRLHAHRKSLKFFKKHRLSEYHDLYAESDVLLLPTIASFFSAPRLACQAA